MAQSSDKDVVVLYTRLLDAWNRRRADDYAACFTQSASVVGFDGSQMSGRAAIETELRAIFADHPTAAYVAKVRELRELVPGVWRLRAVAGMVPAGRSEVNPALNAVQSLVFVEEPAGPRIDLLQNTPAAFHGRPQLVAELTAELTQALQAGTVVDSGGDSSRG
jgi:uncharacterized protein (TIGR02246 family)